MRAPDLLLRVVRASRQHGQRQEAGDDRDRPRGAALPLSQIDSPAQRGTAFANTQLFQSVVASP